MQFHSTSLSHRFGNQALKFSLHNYRRVRNGKVCNEDIHFIRSSDGGDRKMDNTFVLTSHAFLEVK